jgi:hypothetical protein
MSDVLNLLIFEPSVCRRKHRLFLLVSESKVVLLLLAVIFGVPSYITLFVIFYFCKVGVFVVFFNKKVCFRWVVRTVEKR